MLKSITKTAAVSGLALAVGLGGLTLGAGDAAAGHRNNSGKYLAAAGLGLITGAIIANAARDRHYYRGAYDPYHYDGYYAPRRSHYAAPPRVYYEPQGYYEPRGYYHDAPAHRYSSSTGRDENQYGGYDCSARWQAYDTGSASTNVGVGGDHCR